MFWNMKTKHTKFTCSKTTLKGNYAILIYHWTDMVLLYIEVSYKARGGFLKIYLGEGTSTLTREKIISAPK